MNQTGYIQIIDGVNQNEITLDKAINSLPTGMYEFSFKRKNRRSNQQNKYWWSVVVPMVKDGLRDMGYSDVKTNEDSHEVLKALFLKRIISNGLEELPLTRSTTKLSKTEFMELIDDVAKWCSQYLNFYLPMPNEQVELFQ